MLHHSHINGIKSKIRKCLPCMYSLIQIKSQKPITDYILIFVIFKVIDEDGIEQGWEEIFDYIFPEDEASRPNLKLLAAAKNWKKATEETDI